MIKRLAYSLFFISFFGSSIAQSPSIGGYNVYYGILHNHSNVSDGTGTDDAAYNYAKNTAKLDFFSTANHEGYIVEAEWAAIKAASDKYNEDSVFTAFWGFEWSNNGHVAVINTDDYPGISSDPSGTFVELCAWLDARNGIAFFNHPGRGQTCCLMDSLPLQAINLWEWSCLTAVIVLVCIITMMGFIQTMGI